MRPIEQLWSDWSGPALDLPGELELLYGGPLGLGAPLLYANFVASLDGVVAIRSQPRSNRLISGSSEADRFVMGLLRACADAVVVGSGTLNASPRSLWTAEQAFPAAAEAFAELRRRLGLRPLPVVAVLTGSGSVDPTHPALGPDALVLTTAHGAERLERHGPFPAEVVALGEGASADAARAVELLRGRGHARILSEAGPHVFGALVHAGLVDELFLTLSPVLAGRSGQTLRLGLVEGRELLPRRGAQARLVDVRRHGAHLFLRYGFRARPSDDP